MAGSDLPVDAPRRIAGLIVANAEEFHSGSADARRDCTCVDARATRPDGHLPDAADIRQDEQGAGGSEIAACRRIRPRSSPASACSVSNGNPPRGPLTLYSKEKLRPFGQRDQMMIASIRDGQLRRYGILQCQFIEGIAPVRYRHTHFHRRLRCNAVGADLALHLQLDLIGPAPQAVKEVHQRAASPGPEEHRAGLPGRPAPAGGSGSQAGLRVTWVEMRRRSAGNGIRRSPAPASWQAHRGSPHR